MLCHQCGSPVSSDESSCRNCGAELKRVSERVELRSDGLRRMTQQLRAIKAEGRFFPPSEVISERFTLGEMIGKGPFGEVYRAEDSFIEAEVALKIFDPALIENPRHQEQFLRIAHTARTMTQANVVRVHGSGAHKGHVWVSMQQLEGLSLRKVMEMRRSKGERFSLEELEPIVGQVTLAIQHINREFPHGNLKPENILFLPELIKLTDHYLYAAIDHELFADRLSESAYIAPELHTPSQEADRRCDVYSLGVLIGEMVFGPDFAPGSRHPEPTTAAPIDAICRRATAFDPAERYPSVEALSEDFATVVDTGSRLHAAKPSGGSSTAIAPPPAPSAPPAPAGGDPLVEETSRSIGQPPEEEIATREFDRGGHAESPELGDLLETNEVRREQLPGPEDEADDHGPGSSENGAGSDAPRLDSNATGSEPSHKEPTATAVRPEPRPTDDDDDPPYVIAAGLAMLVAAIVAIFALSGSKDDKRVEIGGADEAVAEADPVHLSGDDAGARPDETMDDAPLEAASRAGHALLAARGRAVVAAEKAGEDVPEEDESEEADQAPESEGSDGARQAAEKTPSERGAASKPASGRAKQPPAATNCKGGMVLVKSKSGNYCVDAYEYPARGSEPTTNVSWFRAKQLCEAKGKRLCTLDEWQGACGSKYPYGKSWDSAKCNTVDEDDFERSLTAAGEFNACRSWTGAYDMTGNAHEWLADQRIAGGGFDSGPEVASCRYSSAKAPGSSSANIGFRCCADAE